MSVIKLKNCPFCGSEVELEDIGEDSNDHYYMIACKNSSCGSSTCFGEVSKDDFISVWNTRKPIDDIVQQLNELAEEEFQEGLREPLPDDAKPHLYANRCLNKAAEIIERSFEQS